MIAKKLLRDTSIFCLIILVFIGNNQAQTQEAEAYLGKISSDKINQGDTLSFSGSFFNTNNVSYSVFAMNATFIEILGESGIRDAERFDYSKGYPGTGLKLDKNQIYTDVFDAKIDLNPGKYNVSIGFASHNGTISSSDQWEYHYALVNQTVEVFGTSNSINIARGIGYALLGFTVLIIFYWIYTKFR